ncbi:MAG: T9SS type A sorting domain-containing protein [Saprospiraceae bacterium]|nr:T9SS type A sorting domain-containing protein [Saprospiraceae bacterium]
MKYLFTMTMVLMVTTVVLSQQLAQGFSIQRMAGGLNPVSMTIDHHDRIWLVEKDGRVLIVESNGEILPDPFIILEVNEFNERGLLGIALHPDMDNQPYVYLYYTVPNGRHNRVSRVRANGDLAVPGSEEILLDLDLLSGAIHNGGAMVFDNEGHLFIATGEAGLAANSQNPNNLLGKILRIHDDGTIPTDNPFFDVFEGKNRAIWSMGHRNPFNLAYDYITNRLYASDVGGGHYEEINLVEKGKNYGYPLVEGPIQDQAPPENYQDPYYAYPYEVGKSCAIVALAIYRSEELSFGSEFDGAIFFADYCGGYFRVLKEGTPSQVQEFASGFDRPLNILINQQNGDLFFQTRAGQGGGSPEDNTISTNGELWKLFFKGNGSPEIVNELPDVVRTIGEEVSFTINAIGSDTLQYNWYMDDQMIIDENNSTILFENLDLDMDGSLIYCVVTNTEGSDTSNVAKVTIVSNTRPTVEITAPLGTNTFSAGDTIFFTGKAFDAEDGPLASSALSWKIDFHHNEHTHPFVENLSETDHGFVIVPTSGETDTNVWIRIYLRATDLEGLQSETYTEIFPEFAQVTLISNLPASVSIDGAVRSLPLTFKSMRGLTRIIEVPQIQEEDDFLILYDQWADGWKDEIRLLQPTQSYDTLLLLFDTIAYGSGQGLYGEYFSNDFEHDLDGTPDLIRIDSIIDFGWGNDGPAKQISTDFFSARWRGFLAPLFTEKYTLSIASDDGARMWINNKLVFDFWHPQATREHFFDYRFEGGKKYRIRIEYFERDGGAAMHFRWQSDRNKREHVPDHQMYAMGFGAIKGRVWVDINENNMVDDQENGLAHSTVFLFDEDLKLITTTVADSLGQFSWFSAEEGNYIVHIVPPNDSISLRPGYGLDAWAFSEIVSLSPNDSLDVSYGFVPSLSTASSKSISDRQIIFYPNPIKQDVHLSTTLNIDAIDLYNELGEVILTSPITRLTEQIFVLDCSHLASGVYFAKVRASEGVFLKKLLKI